MSRPAARESVNGAQRDRAAQIVEAAGACLARKGYANTSLKEIAAEAQVAPSLLHYYFDSKEHLLVEVVRSVVSRNRDEMRRDFELSSTPIEKVNRSVDRARRRCRENPGFYRLLFDLITLGIHQPAIGEQVAALFSESDHELQQSILEVEHDLDLNLADKGIPDRSALARVIIAAVDGLALQSLFDPGLDIDAAFDALRVMLLRLGDVEPE